MGQCSGHDITCEGVSLRQVVWDKYQVDQSANGILGEGTSCICRKGTCAETEEPLAVKFYKRPKHTRANWREVAVQKHRRAVKVLQTLQRPFKRPSDPKLWNSQLDHVKPQNLFVKLVDYSKDIQGEPGYDFEDGELYMVTELADHSLLDFLKKRRRDSAPLSKETVRNLTKAILLVMAGLHAKGFVHLDMKPENLMIFAGKLKLIDVDGCVNIGTHIELDDPSICFSPCYCAPEWAKALRDAEEEEIIARPSLDAWSVGCTICELVTLDAILRPKFQQFYERDKSGGKKDFMDWLASLQKAPVPRVVEQFDSELLQLLTSCLLVCQQSDRLTCAESLDVPYLEAGKVRRTKSSPITVQV